MPCGVIDGERGSKQLAAKMMVVIHRKLFGCRRRTVPCTSCRGTTIKVSVTGPLEWIGLNILFVICRDVELVMRAVVVVDLDLDRDGQVQVRCRLGWEFM